VAWKLAASSTFRERTERSIWRNGRRELFRGDFDENRDAGLNHFVDGIEPATGEVTWRMSASRLRRCGDGFGVHVGDQRDFQRGEIRAREVLLRRFCAGAMSGNERAQRREESRLASRRFVKRFHPLASPPQRFRKLRFAR